MSVWDTLIGQPDALTALQRASADERPTHAWLFTGPPGAGRETAALAFAAALLCERELGQRGRAVLGPCVGID